MSWVPGFLRKTIDERFLTTGKVKICGIIADSLSLTSMVITYFAEEDDIINDESET